MAFNLTFFKSRKQDTSAVNRNDRHPELDPIFSLFSGGGAGGRQHLKGSKPNGLSARSTSSAIARPSSPALLSTTQRPGSRASSPQAPILESEDLDENTFYITVERRFSYVFSRVSVLCVPHTWSIGGLEIDKEFVETHALVPSPYFQGQYQSFNGKVVSIDNDIISEISGFTDPRNVRIISEELMYNERYAYKKIRMLLIERPLVGEGTRTPDQYVPLISPVREFSSDLEFLKSFPENAAALHELETMINEFVETYIYVRGWATSTVEKIQNIYQKVKKNVLNGNAELKKACRVQSENDHFMELMENVVMGYLHDKIYIQSLCPVFSRDREIESLMRSYCRDTIPLRKYGVDNHLRDMPLEYFDGAIRCLRRIDADNGLPDPDPRADEDEPADWSFPAITPLEKLCCVKRTLELISDAGDKFVQENGMGYGGGERAMVTTDDLIPLLAYVIVRSRITRLDSLVFYMQHFRLCPVERSELSHALVSFQASIEFMRPDPLGIHDASSTLSTNSNSSNVSVLSYKAYQRTRSRSSSISVPMSPPLLSPTNSNHTYTFQPRSSLGPSSTPPTPSSTTSSNPISSVGPTPAYHHRKSATGEAHVPEHLSSDRSDTQQRVRRSSLTPSLIIKPQIVLPAISESRRSLDTNSDRLVHDRTVTSADNAPHYLILSRPIIPPVPLERPGSPKTCAPPLPLLVFPQVQNEGPVRSRSPSLNNIETIAGRRTASRSRSPVMSGPPEVIDVRSRGSFEAGSRPGSALSRRPVFESDIVGELGEFLTALSITSDDIGNSGMYRESAPWQPHVLRG